MLTLKAIAAIGLSVAIVSAGSAAFADDDLPPTYDVFSGTQEQPLADGVVLQQTKSTRGIDGSRATDQSDQADESAVPTGCDALGATEPKACNALYRDVAGEPAVTLTDLAIVRPEAAVLTGDPVGYGLMNAPANIIATARDQTITTTLFNRPVQVRFVPVAYTFDYGDGAFLTTDTGGSTWQEQGLPQFTPTATTHVYHQRATFTVAVTVAYAPFVDFGSGWRAVAGTVSATGPGYDIQIVEARTALVAHDCNEDPSGVGCPVR